MLSHDDDIFTVRMVEHGYLDRCVGNLYVSRMIERIVNSFASLWIERIRNEYASFMIEGM